MPAKLDYIAHVGQHYAPLFGWDWKQSLCKSHLQPNANKDQVTASADLRQHKQLLQALADPRR